MSSHVGTLGKTVGQTLTSQEITDLFNLLGIGSYVKGIPCAMADYSPINAERWEKGKHYKL